MESISVILPAFDDSHNLEKQINCLNNQTLRPNEIIIVDSSSDNKIEDMVNLISSTVQIKYFRIGRGFKLDRYLLYLSKLLSFLKKNMISEVPEPIHQRQSIMGPAKQSVKFLHLLICLHCPSPTGLKITRVF